MEAYSTFLIIIQVLILGTMFYVLKKHGKKALLKLAGVLLLAVLIMFAIFKTSQDTQASLNIQEENVTYDTNGYKLIKKL